MEVYFDNATTSWPKAPTVGEAMKRFIEETGASAGRGGHHRVLAAGRMVFEVRELLARLIGARDSSRVIFTLNATEALNTVLKGWLRAGDRVVTSAMEHNSVARPLRRLQDIRGVRVATVPCDAAGCPDLDALASALDAPTALVAFVHGSNVTGTLMPIAEIAAMARARGARILIDAAQTVGCVPIDVAALGVDFLVFSGHKSLLGPHGVGVLYVAPGLDLEPLKEGGTGSNSEQDTQPDFWPDKFESGTLNAVGVVGLGEGVRFVLSTGVAAIQRAERQVVARLLAGLAQIPEVSVYGPPAAEARIAVVSLSLAGWDAAELGRRLDESFGIMGRPGLHCAPAAHRTIGTLGTGTYRLAPGLFSTAAEVDYVLDALAQLARERR